MKTIRNLHSLLNFNEKRVLYIITFLTFFTGLIEVLGILSIMPFMTFLMDSSSEVKNAYLKEMYSFFDYKDTNEFIFLLGCITLFLFVFSTIFKCITTYLTYRFSYMREYSISKRLVSGYLNQPYIYFLNKTSSNLVKTVLLFHSKQFFQD